VTARVGGWRAWVALGLLVAMLGLGARTLIVHADGARAEVTKCPGVDLAPRLASDRGTPSTQTLDARGRYVPIVVVHGWTSRSTHNRGRSGAFSHLIDLSDTVGRKPAAQRSLIGQLQKIPGAAVYTFDYHDLSAQWVTHERLGPALGKALDCLYEKSGEKVIVVAHSMGGLIARWAVTHDADGGGRRSEHVSTVVTFATPQTGSLLAKLADGVIDSSPQLVVLRIILADCGRRTARKFETGTICDFLPDFMQAFRTPSGDALQAGSPQLKALDPFPKDVTYLDALAGETTLKVPEYVGWFETPLTRDVNIGDIVVMQDSAIDHSSAHTVAHCAYQLNAVRAQTDQIGLTLGQVSQQDVAQPLWKVFGPCFHSNLMRTERLTNEATAIIAEDISKRRPVATQQTPLTATADPDDKLPTCSEYGDMEPGQKDVVLRRMQEDHNDTLPRFVVKGSVLAYCALNPGRHIDGIYAPGSHAPDGGSGPLPLCSAWRDLDDVASDAALLRLARQRGDAKPDIHALRLVVGVYCKFKPDHRIDDSPGG
jgi:pimeloyl-ACP methyl ester carboxylesterase